MEQQGKNPLSSAPFWKRINRLRESKRRKAIGSLNHNGLTVTDDKEKSEIFADSLEKKLSRDEKGSYNKIQKENVEKFLSSQNFLDSYSRAE